MGNVCEKTERHTIGQAQQQRLDWFAISRFEDAIVLEKCHFFVNDITEDGSF